MRETLDPYQCPENPAVAGCLTNLTMSRFFGVGLLKTVENKDRPAGHNTHSHLRDESDILLFVLNKIFNSEISTGQSTVEFRV